MTTALLHQTDLFRPHNDPDDHWDLACVFALAVKGLVPLAGVLIDHPPGPPILNHASDPDVAAVAQLSYLSGLSPPVGVGSPHLFSTRGDFKSSTAPSGVQFILRTLRESPVPVAIGMVGSARDVAEAIVREPGLFAEKCARIYLSAGNGHPDRTKVPSLEWNAAIDPPAFAQIFRAPCPVYWMACLDDEDRFASMESRTYASHFRFRQGEILSTLPQPLQNFFGFMFEKRASSFWLHALREDFANTLGVQHDLHRMMYSTAIYFDVAGHGVTTSGEMRPQSEQRTDWVYQFQPTTIDCRDDGHLQWKPGGDSNRKMFHILNTAAYPTAMTRAMKHLLTDAFVDA